MRISARMTLLLAACLVISQSLLLAHASDHAVPGADDICQLCAHSPQAAGPAQAPASLPQSAPAPRVLGLQQSAHPRPRSGIVSIRGPPDNFQL